jgi:hypothetical protein
MNAQPEHGAMCTAVGDLCAETISKLETRLGQQRELDAATARKLKEEAKAWLELACVEAERGENKRLERVRMREQDQMEIEAVERELEVRQKALCDAYKDADRVEHRYGNTRSVSETGTAGTGTVVDFDTPQYTATHTRSVAGIHGLNIYLR